MTLGIFRTDLARLWCDEALLSTVSQRTVSINEAEIEAIHDWHLLGWCECMRTLQIASQHYLMRGAFVSWSIQSQGALSQTNFINVERELQLQARCSFFFFFRNYGCMHSQSYVASVNKLQSLC